MNKKYFLLFSLVFLTRFGSATDQGLNLQLSNQLSHFHKNPSLAMEKLPVELVESGYIDRGSIDYSKVQSKLSSRGSILKYRGSTPLAVPLDRDLAKNIVDDGLLVSNIVELEKLHLPSFELEKTPWADSYWPTYKGLIGIRYNDPQFPDSNDFQENLGFVSSKPAQDILDSLSATEIDQLSPAEKYDILTGDSEWTLTNYSWNVGRKFLAQNGSIPLWMGICHGWSAAAHMGAKVSYKPVKVKSVNNVDLTFYPSDIKALTSLLWANASPPVKFIGAKCHARNPAKNANGRVIDETCNDNNPASFHLVITNQLGLNLRSFIMDATFDAEIWNFPLTAFRYSYFNPQTLAPTKDLRLAMVPIESFNIDKFKEFRSPAAKYVIGVAMDDTYVIEIAPGKGAQNKPPLKTIRHIYDLELDSNYNIIGGEWYSNAHPDFIWTYTAGAIAKSIVEEKVSHLEWSLDGGAPPHWTPYAQMAAKRGQPLLAIIEALLLRENP